MAAASSTSNYTGFGVAVTHTGVQVKRSTGTSSSSNTVAGSDFSRCRGCVTHPVKVLVAHVALGKQCRGSRGLKRPPFGFDSVHCGGAPGQRISVVFDNHAAYPEYVVTLLQ